MYVGGGELPLPSSGGDMVAVVDREGKAGAQAREKGHAFV